VQEVRLTFSVADEQGRPKLDLTKDDLDIVDVDRAPLQLRSFTLVNYVPLRELFLIDGSSSQDKWFAAEKFGVIALVARLQPGIDSAATVVFSDAGQFDKRFAASGHDLIRNIDIRVSENVTEIYDAIYRGCSALARFDESAEVRRAIILLSDGVDNASMYGPEEAMAQAQRKDVAIYTISTGNSRSSEGKMLAKISSQTGARSFFVKNAQEIQAALREVQSDLQTRYSVTYTPPSSLTAGSFRPVKISISRPEHLSVRVRSGYYVPEEH
jgi:VWFA-related protein